MAGLDLSNDKDGSNVAINHVPTIWRLVMPNDQPIVPLTRTGYGVPIYCIHSIGGDLAGYDRLAQALGPGHRIFGLQVPKSMMMADSATSIEVVGRRYADMLAKFQPEGPFVIAGYSAGAVIGLEVAQQLRLQGRDVPLLVAFDGAPSNSGAGLGPRQLGYIWRLICNVPWRLGSIRLRDLSLERLRMRITIRGLQRSPKDLPEHRSAEWKAVRAVVERAGWPEHQRKFIRTMFRAMVLYVPRAYDGTVILYEVRAQPFFRLMQYGAVWRKLAKACEVVQVNGRHSDFFESRSTLDCLSAHLNIALQKIDQRSADGSCTAGFRVSDRRSHDVSLRRVDDRAAIA